MSSPSELSVRLETGAATTALVYHAIRPAAASAQDALKGADAAIIATEWPEFRELSADDFKIMARPLVLDQSRFLNAQLSGKAEYVTTGRSA